MSKDLLCNSSILISFNNKLCRVCGIVLFFLFLIPIQAQRSAYTVGTEFTTVYSEPNKNIFLQLTSPPYNWDTVIYTTVYIIGSNPGCATVEVPGLNFTKTVTVPKDSIIAVQLPYNPVYPHEAIIERGVFISTASPMGVLQSTNLGKGGGTSRENVWSATASAVIPDKVVLQSFLALPFSSGSSFLYSNHTLEDNFYTIISLENSNNLEVHFYHNVGPPGGSPTILAGTTANYKLNRGDIFTFYGQYYNQLFNPFNPLYVKSTNTKAFKLYKFPQDLQVTYLVGGASLAYEEMKPLSFYGLSFHTGPLAGNSGNQYSLHAVTDSTVVSFNGTPAIVLDSLEYIDTCITGPMHIQSDKPLYAYLASCPDESANNNGESPLSVSLSADNELIGKSIFQTFDEPDTSNHYILGVVTKTYSTGRFKLDGNLVGAASFTPFSSDSSWSWANFEISTGTHTAESDSGFHGIQYTYYIHPDPQQNNFHFPSYGYVLPESISWPPDSFNFKAGASPSELQDFSSFQTVLCPGQELHVKPPNLRHTTWQWDFGDGNSATQITASAPPNSFSYSWDAPGSYWLKVTDSLGCSPSDSILIEVASDVTADFTYEVAEACEGQYIQLQNQSTGASTFQWEWAGESSAIRNPAFIYEQAGKLVEVQLIASNAWCSDTTTELISIENPEFDSSKIPNVITPNGDGINEEFCIPASETFEGCYDLQVFNRWGRLMFSSTDPEQCWTPQKISPGVYFYVLSMGRHNLQGNLHVIN